MSFECTEEEQYHLQVYDDNLRRLCRLVLWVVGVIAFLLLELLWIVLPLNMSLKDGLICLTIIAVPVLGAVSWYALNLWIPMKVSRMRLQAIYQARNALPLSPTTQVNHVEEVRQERVEDDIPTPAEVDDLDSIPATFTVESERRESVQLPPYYYPSPMLDLP